MAKYSSPDLVVTVGGTALTGYVKTIGGFAPTAETADITTFGDAWREFQAHLKDGGEFTLEGDYDDTAVSGPDVILNNIGDTVAVVIGWGGSDAGKPRTSVSAIISKYERRAAVGSIQGFVATMRSSGAVTEDTYP